MAESISDFLLRMKESRQATSVGAAQVVLGSVQDKPDEVAADLKLADEFGKLTGNPIPPLPMVKEYRGVFAEAVERERNKTILSSAPVLSDWLRDPKNASLARDTLPELAWWERMGKSFQQGNATTIKQGSEFSRDMGVALETSPLGQALDGLGRAFDRTILTGPDGKPNILGVLANYARSNAQAGDGIPRQMVGGPDVSLSERADAIANRNLGPIYQGARLLLSQMERDGFAPTKLDDVTSVAKALQFVGDNLAMSTPQMVTAIASGAFSPLLQVMTLGGEANAELAAKTQLPVEQRVMVATGAGVAMAALDYFGLSRVFGGIPVGEVATEAVGGTLVSRLINNGLTEAAARTLQAAIAEGTTEALQDGIVMGVTALSGGQYEQGEVVKRLIEAFAAGGASGGAMRGGVEASQAIANRIGRRTADAEAADQRKAMFEELSGNAATSPLRTRMPQAFQDFIARATENGPIENVFVPADQFVTYFQGVGVDPNAIVTELGLSRDDLDAALAGGGDLRIPTAVYAAKIAGSEHDAFLMENMRFDPDEFTSAEAAEFNARAEDAMREAWEIAEAQRVDEERYRAVEQTIYDEMVSRLRVAGRSTEVATTEAMLYPAFYRVMAERSGLTTEEFLAQYPLPQVQGELPQGMQYRDVDALTRTLAEARSRRTAGAERRGPSLLEFISDRGGINDVGGELRAMGADTIKRGRGKKTLRVARSGFVAGMTDMLGGSATQYSPDTVAQAAIEAGYLANDPIVLEYQQAMREGREVPDITRALWDAIDREMRGEAQYVANTEADARDAEQQSLDQIEAYLNQIGVSLEQDDATIRAAIEADQAGRQYGQVTPDQARAIDMPVELPTDTAFAEAVANTPGAEITADGLLIDLVRFQKEEQAGSTSVRTGVFYLPVGSSNARHYKAGGQPGQWYGGPVKVQGQTLIKRPLFVKGATGGKAPEAAFDAIKGKGASKKLNSDARSAATAPRDIREEVVAQFLETYGADASMAWEIIENSKLGNQLTYALQEHAVAQAARDAGYDAVVGYSKGRAGAFISEVFDVREIDYPTPGQTATLHPQFEGRQYGQARRLFDRLPRNLLSEGDIEGLVTGVPVTFDFAHNTESATAIFGIPDADAPFDRGIEPSGRYVTVVADAGRVDTSGRMIAGTITFQNPLVMDAGTWKRDLFEKYGKRGKELSKAIIADGHDGVMTVSRDDRPGRSHISEVLDLTTFDEARALYQESPRGARGSIQFPGAGVGNGDTIIRLFENADLSTVLHESGHYFLTVMQDLAAKGEANAVADYGAVKDWWYQQADAVAKDAMRVMPDVNVTADDVRLALDGGTTGDVMKDGAIDVGMQEQWARAFEAYLMEGKAPNADLRSAFEKFRAWLISIYQRLAGLNVTVSDELRGVFDRMLASDGEIAKAKVEAGDLGLTFPSAEQMGLTQEEYDRFLKLRSQAEDDTKARMLREVMAPIKRQQEKWFKDERAKVKAEVENDLNRSPVYRAMEWMGNRRWLGEGQPEQMPDIRLSKDILVERYGEGVLKTLPRGKQTVYAVDGGLDPDDAAGWFGFDSGDQMIKSMERAPKRTEAIEAETDRIMRERHGDVLNDGTAEQQALDALHTDKKGQWLAAELKAISEVSGLDVGMTAKEARETARQTIARMRVRDALAANRFLVAERKAGEEAQRLATMLGREGVWMQNARRRIASKARAVTREEVQPDAVAGQIDQANRSTGNYNETVQRLAQAKRRQLLNHALYSEARKVTDEVEKAERFVAKLGKASHRERIAGAGRRENAQIDYLAAIDDVLDRYDFRRLSGRAEQRRGALNAFVEQMKAAGRENELSIPDAVLADAARRPYKTLPVEELRGVVDSLKNLEHVALRWDKLIDAERERELSAVVDDITAAFDANVPKRPPGRVRTTGEAARNTVRQFFDLVLNAGTILREIDGFADLGAAYRNIKQPIDDAMSRLIGRKEKAAADLEALYAVYTADERRRMGVREFIPELGMSLSKWERIAVALNTGNAGNYQRLTDKRVRGAFTEAQVNAILGSLDARDAAFVQSVWDYVGSFRADIAARERRTTGVEPQWVEAQPVTIAGKVLAGGYYPLKYDPRLSSLARDDQANEIANSLQAGRFGKAQTRNGHTKERAQSSGRDVELDMSVLHRHVNQVIYDLELSEPVSNSWRILQNSRVRTAFIDAGKQADFDALEIWLKDVAEGELRSADLVGRAARTLKSNFTASKLALNLGTVALQVTGLAQSAVVVGKRNMAIGMQQSLRPGVEADIVAKSAFMRTRQTTFNKDIFDFYNDPAMGPAMSRWGEFKSKVIGPVSFWLMTKVQWHTVDKPTWLAGYHQGLRKFGNDEAKAIQHADAIVKRAQASGLFSDRSAVERGSVSRTARQNDVVRLFTALGSYMFAKFNVAYERSAVAQRTISREGVSLRSAQEALSWALDMAFLFTLEAALVALIKGNWPGEDDDEEWTTFLAKETGLAVMGTVPFVRDLAGPMQGFGGGGAYGSITTEVTRPFQQIMQGEVDKALVKSIVNATGLATGLPATQFNRTVVDPIFSEDETSPMEYLFGQSKK